MTARHSYGAHVVLTTVTAVLACFALGSAAAWADLNEGLIAHWPLNEGQGTWTEDVAGNHDGTIYGGPPWVAGVTGFPSDYALDFDGSNDYVNVGQFTQFGGTQPFSLCAWINRTTISGSEPYILNNMYSSSRGIGMFSYGNYTAVTVGGRDGTIYQASVFDFEDIADGYWHLIVGTYDGSALQLYIDGEWRGSNSDFSYYTASTQNMNIARMEQGARCYFDGRIDEPRIYDRALSPDEVHDLWEMGGVNQPPVADAGGPYAGVVDQQITFDASASYDPEGDDLEFRWDIDNDGNWDSPWLPALYWTFTYDVEYHGLAKLQVKDNQGATALDTAQVDILPPGGANDDCANAWTVGQGSVLFSTESATTDGPPTPACGDDDQIYYDIWYRFVVPTAGHLYLSTCGAADFDTKIAVYDTVACHLLPDHLIGCNDDAPGCPDGTSALALMVRAGSYKIRLGSAHSWTVPGTGTLQIAYTSDPVPHLVAALNHLQDVAFQVLDEQIDRVATKYADVVVELRDFPDQLLYIIQISAGISTLLTNPAPMTWQQLKAATGLSDEIAQLITSTFTQLKFLAIDLGALVDSGLIWQAIDDWVQSEEGADVLDTGSRDDIANAVRACVANTAAYYDGDSVAPHTDLAGLKGLISGRFDTLKNHIIQNGLPQDYPTTFVLEALDALSFQLEWSVINGEIIAFPIHDALAPEVLGSPANVLAALDDQIASSDLFDSVDILATAAVVGVSIAKVASWFATAGVAAAAQVACFAVGVITSGESFISASIDETLKTTSYQAIHSAVDEANKVSNLLLRTVGYLDTFDYDIPSCAYTQLVEIEIPAAQELPAGRATMSFSGTMTVTNGSGASDAVEVMGYMMVSPIYRGSVGLPVAYGITESAIVGPGEQWNLEVVESSLLPDNASTGSEHYLATAWLVVAPSVRRCILGPERATFRVVKSGRGRAQPATFETVGVGLVEQNQWAWHEYGAAGGIYGSELLLLWEADDLDLHIYDEVHRHVGMNYATGEVELQIPGATYSGATARPEIVQLPGSAEHEYYVAVFGAEVRIATSYDVLAMEVPVRSAELAVFPTRLPVEHCAPGYGSGECVESGVLAREVGGQEEYTGLFASATDLVGESGVIPSENVVFDLPSSTIPAGGALRVGVSIAIPYALPSGTYVGTLAFGAEPVAIPVSLNLGYAPTRPTTPLGPTSGFVALPYVYSALTTDPEAEALYYRFYWGDGTETEWLGPFELGETCTASHAWLEAGTYDVRVTAKDEGGWYSLPSEPLTVLIDVGLCDELGGTPGLDADLYIFEGTAGEEVTVGLVEDGERCDDRATLVVTNIGLAPWDCWVYRMDRSVLPNEISLALPCDGCYLVIVAEQFHGYEGPYCVTVHSSGDAASTLEPWSPGACGGRGGDKDRGDEDEADRDAGMSQLAPVDVNAAPNQTWRLKPSAPDYPAELDADGDGDVDARDLDVLLRRAEKP
ncbi:MAG: hypothetical protein JXQ75_04665 [Phycisphaerae bacterium]|nr:hypothetical protein [Phycisphaerae bacterium]